MKIQTDSVSNLSFQVSYNERCSTGRRMTKYLLNSYPVLTGSHIQLYLNVLCRQVFRDTNLKESFNNNLNIIVFVFSNGKQEFNLLHTCICVYVCVCKYMCDRILVSFFLLKHNDHQ